MTTTPSCRLPARYLILLVSVVLVAGCDGASSLAPSPTPPSPAPPPPAAAVTVSALTVAPDAVLGGADATGTVTLSAAAPSGGAAVTLTSSHGAAAVPASVQVPAGATSVAFQIATSDVSGPTAVTIAAAAGGATRSAVLEVRPVARQAAGFSIEPDRIRGGETATGRVVLGAFAATASAATPTAVAPVVITLTSSHSSVHVPSSVTVPGGSTEATFPIDTTSVSQQVDVVLTASSGGVTRTTGMQVLSAGPTLAGMSPTAIRAGQSATVTLTGSGFIAGDTSVFVRGAATGVTVSDVTVQSATSLTATIAVSSATTPGNYPVTVETSGGASGSASLTVLPMNGSQTFNFTGAAQTFVVPAGVTAITIEAAGAAGAPRHSSENNGGRGGSVTATVAVTPGETLTVMVGGRGAVGFPVQGIGGFNGGANSGGTAVIAFGGGGGGASDVRRGSALANRIVVAGGGGGAGANNAGFGGGGAGGGLTGAAGGAAGGGGGGGGTAAAGGAGGANGCGGCTGGAAGALGTGGGGGNGSGGGGVTGGGGGGGYYGGGGGGGSTIPGAGGGGGGSSFAIATATSVTHQQGVRSGDGVVVIRW